MSVRIDPPGVAVLSITEVERQTGIRPATLRMWERRYGFPQPLRDCHGDRIYPLNQVERLHAARRLIAQGVRPGKIFSSNTAAAPADSPLPAAPPGVMAGEYAPLLGLLRQYRRPELHSHFQYRLLELGLRRFVIEFLAPLSTAVGMGWGCGELPVRCAQLYSQLSMCFLHTQLAAARTTAGVRGPRAVLATPTGETHALGILMVEAILATFGADCVQLGSELPSAEVAAAARDTGADIVALSISAYFPRRDAQRIVKELRAMLPCEASLWVGGGGAAGNGMAGLGVEVFDSLAAIEPALLRWHSRQRRSESAAV